MDTYLAGLLTQRKTLGTDGSTILSFAAYAYDGLRRMTISADSTGTTLYTYFQDGTQKSVQSSGHNPVTVTELDLATNDPISTTRADGGVVQTPENGLGQIASQSGPGVLAASFAYDPNTGQMNGFSSNFSYDFTNTQTAFSPSWSFDHRTGLPVVDLMNTYMYGTDRQTAYGYGSGATGWGFDYNNAGEVTSSNSGRFGVPSSSSTAASPFDELGRSKGSVEVSNGRTYVNTVSYTPQQQFDVAFFGSAGGTFVNHDYFPSNDTSSTGSPGALQTVTVQPPDEQAPVQTNYSYGPVDKRLKTITVNGIDITYTYRAASDQVQSVTAGNVSTTYTPDSSDPARAGEISVLKTDTQVNLFDQAITAYNQQDQRTNETVSRVNEPSQSLAYNYDPAQADALTSVTRDNAVIAQYSYDAMGNRIGGVVAPRYAWQAYYSGNGYQQPAFDGAGNQTDGGTNTYTFDGANRLTGTTPSQPVAGSKQSQFGYDGQGRLLWQDVNVYNADSGTWTLSYSRHFVWDGWNMIAMLDGNDTLLQAYTYGPTGLVAITSYPADPANPDPALGATTFLTIADASGNIVELVNPLSGTVEASYHYGAYGDSFSATGPAAGVCPFGFAGGYRDTVSGLYYFQQRWYNPDQGTFISEDPSGVDGGLNLYSYAGNDPVNKSDPAGLAPEPVWSLNIPSNPKTVTDLATATQFKNEAYNRSQFYKTTLPPAPPPPIPNPFGGVIVIPPADYAALGQQSWDSFQKWEAREKELSDANTLLTKWLLKHTDAKYGQYRASSGSAILDPLAPVPGVKETPFHISRPWGTATWDVLSAGIIGKGGAGSKSLEDVDPSSGYLQPERARPGTSRERIDPNAVKNGATDARANAGEAGAEVAASALQEGLNGLKEVDVITWTKGTQSGFYIKGRPATIGDTLIQAWTGVKGLWDRGMW